MIRILWGFIFASFSPALAWVGGYDFNERGAEAVLCILWAIFLFTATLTFPGRLIGETKRR